MADNSPTPQEAYTLMTQAVEECGLKRNGFIDSLMTQFEKKGSLSNKQVFWAAKLANEAIDMADSEMQMSIMESEQDAPFSDVVEFMKAGEKGQKTRLTFDMGRLTVTLSLAPSHGKNPDHIYVKCNRKYVGKITPQGILVAREGYYKEGAEAILHDMVEQGVGAFVLAYGQRTGNCACCARTLTDDRSLKAGVGPICAKRFNITWG